MPANGPDPRAVSFGFIGQRYQMTLTPVPTRLVVMGVAGCGKSSLGQQSAAALGLPLLEGDDFHPAANVAKMRGGMAFLGATRLVAAYRFANGLALLDNHIRGKGPEKSMGSRMFDNYAWHTDLPPGHPMVHGAQTFDQEFNDFWNSDLIIMTGLNLVSNKMADPIWWQSAMFTTNTSAILNQLPRGQASAEGRILRKARTTALRQVRSCT